MGYNLYRYTKKLEREKKFHKILFFIFRALKLNKLAMKSAAKFMSCCYVQLECAEHLNSLVKQDIMQQMHGIKEKDASYEILKYSLEAIEKSDKKRMEYRKKLEEFIGPVDRLSDYIERSCDE